MGNVFITGASTGIGRATAARLVRTGHTVYAGVRKQSDADSLVEELGGNVVPVLVDVTDQQQVRAAAKRVEDGVGPAGLAGLVNNAGIGSGGPIEHVPLEEFRRTIEVNLISHVGVTQAFLPLVREAQGRIVFTGSVSGRVGLPMMGAYAASKFALHGLTEALRAELAPWGIKVVLVEPGPVDTPLVAQKSQDEFAAFKASASSEALVDYAAHIVAGDNIVRYLQKKAVPVERVARVMERALFSSHPKAQYVTGGDALPTAFASRFLPIPVKAFAAGVMTGSRVTAS